MNKAIFLDIDGTLTTTKSGETFKKNSTDIKVIDGVNEGLFYFKSKGFQLFGISNQGGCAAINKDTGKPFKSIESTTEEMQNTLDIFPQLELITFCPDWGNTMLIIPKEGKISIHKTNPAFPTITDGIDGKEPNYNSFRKPAAGMIYKIMYDYKITPSTNLWMIGDRNEDQQAAQAAKIKFLWADTFHKRFTPGMQILENITPEALQLLENIYT